MTSLAKSHNLGCQVLLSLDKTFEHTTANVVALLFQHLQVFLYRIKFCLKDLLLHLRRLWDWVTPKAHNVR